jgi:hypothetical protein
MSVNNAVRTATAIADPNNPPNVLIPHIVTATAVVTSDSDVFFPPALGLYIGGAGNVAVRMYGNQQVLTYVGVPVGTTLPIVVDKVMATNTTATNIVCFSSQTSIGFSFIITEGGNFLITEGADDLITET